MKKGLKPIYAYTQLIIKEKEILAIATKAQRHKVTRRKLFVNLVSLRQPGWALAKKS